MIPLGRLSKVRVNITPQEGEPEKGLSVVLVGHPELGGLFQMLDYMGKDLPLNVYLESPQLQLPLEFTPEKVEAPID